jgi:hypothetical protein
MRIGVPALAMAAVLSMSIAFADAPFATARFAKRDPKTWKDVPITSARIDDQHVCIILRDVSTLDGDHSLSMVIYDGAGREAYRSLGTITAKDKKWAHTICYGFNSDHDVPGTWWYVAELDDQPLVSKELVVARATQPVSANSSLERTRDR